MAHDEPPHQDLHCLQFQLFASLVLKVSAKNLNWPSPGDCAFAKAEPSIRYSHMPNDDFLAARLFKIQNVRCAKESRGCIT